MEKQTLALLVVLLVALCNGTSPLVEAQQMSDRADEDFGLIGAQRFTTNFAPQEHAPEVGASAAPSTMRYRRQLTVPQDSPLNLQGPKPAAPSGASNFFSTLGELGPQIAQAKAFSSLFSSSPNNQQQQQQPGAQSSPFSGLSSLGNAFGGGGQNQGLGQGLGGGAFSMENIMRQLSELSNLIKSTQDRQARTLEATTRSAEAAGSQTMEAARTAQGGIQQALTEMGQGLQRLATNNPNLLPDIKTLYQSVASRLSSASSSVAQTAQAAGQSAPAAGFAPALPKPQS